MFDSFEFYRPSLPPDRPSTKENIAPVPTHKEFLRHCWAHHDNCVLNKAFLFGILPFTGEGKVGEWGATVKGGGGGGVPGAWRGEFGRAKELQAMAGEWAAVTGKQKEGRETGSR